ncbi:LOG family protein [Arthrobacter sp. MYb213]|uniref:LOG family protein n=1 Tax=Arthrobacter sp. MYb213 TaxID=1848595 RepID=UPI000CFD6D7F|nr:LOG family protein [Arthrobacter sp. MYb213]PRB68591.1 Rossmann fold nucleotide-binding protein [Arthrobacter sp. MYb213]
MSQVWPYIPARAVNITTLVEFDRLAAEALDTQLARARNWRVHRVDLQTRDSVLGALDLADCLFIDCVFSSHGRALVEATGGLCMSSGAQLPFDISERDLYTPYELYSGIKEVPYAQVPDAQIYTYSQAKSPLKFATDDMAMASTLHDHHIGQAMLNAVYDGVFANTPMIGVMGGHAVQRGTQEFADAVKLGASLTRTGYSIVTGGGPGAMEAANAGAWLADYEPQDIVAALDILAQAPDAIRHRTLWARTAVRVREQFPSKNHSLGVPTWFYGHEPPNLFATHIAKFFTNSIREAILLEQSNGGIIVLPGAAGTVQEIFQDACENYYATGARVTPIVLVGDKHWREELPVWPLLQALAVGRAMEERIALVDTVDEAVAFIETMTPLRRRTRF